MKKFGILGANGSIGMRHAKNLQELGYETICFDPILANGVKYEDVFEQSDAIIIATPTVDHSRDISHALKTRKPIFCEKPISTYVLGEFGEINMVGYNLRFHGCVITAKTWLENGDIGLPMWANFTCGQYNTKYSNIGSGVILNWSHEIDLALYLLGRGSVVAAAANLTTEMVDFIADISIRHENRCLTSVHLDYVSRPEVRQFIICGTRGQIIVDLLARHAWLRDEDGTPLEAVKDDGSFDEDYLEEIKAFAGKDYSRGCTGPEGVLTLSTCLAAMAKAGAIRALAA